MNKLVSYSLYFFWFIWLFCFFSLIIVETFPEFMNYVHSIYLGAIVSEETYDSLIAFSLWLSLFSAMTSMFFINSFFKKLREFR